MQYLTEKKIRAAGFTWKKIPAQAVSEKKNLYLVGKQQQFFGLVNYREFRQKGPHDPFATLKNELASFF